MASHVRLSQIFFALSNNAIEVYDVPKYTKSKENPPESARLYSLDLRGHRTDVRTLSLSSDDTLLASASNGELHQLAVRDVDVTNTTLGSLKIWNTHTTSCIRTLECGHSVCSTFLPGDQYVRPAVMLYMLVITVPRRSSLGRSQEKCRYLIFHRRIWSRPSRRILRHYGLCMSGQISKRWSLEVLTRMSNSGT